MTDLIWSFAPWFLEDAVACAIVTAIVVLGRAAMHQHVHLLDVASIVYFVALFAVVEAANTSSQHDISNYAQAGAHIALTLIIFGSILVGHPFTESYARETVPEEYWHTPEFLQTNRIISAVWGLAFVVGSISLLIAANTDSRPVLLRIVIPFGALYWAYSYSDKQRKAPAPAASAISSTT
jgi:hypothetical protein